jgi:aerotaxis receptor
MKKNFPINQTEHTFRADEQLISSTDLAGVIRYSNESFAKIAGFSVEELIGKSHNVVRHPDMPQAAFHDMWATLKAGRPWMGMVKNRSKDSGYYWVDAYVTPVFENGSCVGYESVRAVPDPKIRQRAETVYHKIGPAATQDGRGESAERSAKVAAKVAKSHWWDNVIGRILLAVAALLLVIVGLDFIHLSTDSRSLMDMILAAVFGGVIVLLSKPLRDIDHWLSHEVVNNPLMQAVYSGKKGEPGRIETAVRLLQGARRTVLGRIGEEAQKLRDAAQASANELDVVVAQVNEQHGQTDMVATAMNEMAATVQEVARNTAEAAEAAHRASAATKNGAKVTESFSGVIQDIAGQVTTASTAMEQLVASSESIYKVTDLITSISEQTNLLALNASIEAARAGEHGRGFAVVASEVSELAKKTQEATKDIREQLESFKSVLGTSAENLRVSHEKSEDGVRRVGDVTGALGDISRAVETINSMSTQIATATEEQSAVAEEVNQNIVRIRDGSESISQSAARSRELSGDLINLSGELDSLVTRFSHT